MVFYSTNLIKTFEPMRIIHVIPTFILLIIVNQAISQENLSSCLEIVHGNGHVHLNCDNDVIITSVPNQGDDGSEIFGVITTSENHSIRILPGDSFVRMVYEEPSSTDKIHRTRAGGNNGGGGRENALTVGVNTVKIFPNPSGSLTKIYSEKVKITNVKMYNTYGQLLINIKASPQLRYNLDISDLPNGVIILKIQLEDGSIIDKNIIKD